MMSENSIRHVPIVEPDGLIGIISQRDVLAVEESPIYADTPEQRLEREQLIKIDDFYHDNVVTVESNASALSAAKYMQKHKIGCLPVVDNSKLVGIVTDSDFINVAVNLMELSAMQESEFDF